MKRIILLSAITLSLLVTGFARSPLAEGETHCCLGRYVIDRSAEPVFVDGNALETFIIRYQNSELSVKVAIDRSDKKQSRYLVLSDDLEVQYTATRKSFGVQRVNRQYLDDGLSTSDLALEKEAYYYQKVITQSKQNEIGYLRLIAVFYPKLVKDYEQVFAVR